MKTQMDVAAGPEVSVSVYDVSLLPFDHPDWITFLVTVERTAPGWWAVRRGRLCLDATDLTWDAEPIPSERERPWLKAHRFGLERALKLACEVAPLVRVNGVTAMEVLADDETVADWRRIVADKGEAAAFAIASARLQSQPHAALVLALAAIRRLGRREEPDA